MNLLEFKKPVSELENEYEDKKKKEEQRRKERNALVVSRLKSSKGGRR